MLHNHRWREIRIEGEKAFERRDCGLRWVGDQAPDEPRGFAGSGGW